MSQAWYEEKLDLVPSFFDDEQHIVVMEGIGETSITLWGRGAHEPPPPPPKTGAYPIFFADDLEKTHRLMTGRGVETGPIEGDPTGTSWFGFTDPDGNWMEVCTY